MPLQPLEQHSIFVLSWQIEIVCQVVSLTSLISSGQVAELDGCPRMGPTFGAMFMSGQKAAHCALNSLRRQNALGQELPSRKASASDLQQLAKA